MSNYYEDYQMSTREEKLSILMSLKPKDAKEEALIASIVKQILQLPRNKDSGG